MLYLPEILFVGSSIVPMCRTRLGYGVAECIQPTTYSGALGCLSLLRATQLVVSSSACVPVFLLNQTEMARSNAGRAQNINLLYPASNPCQFEFQATHKYLRNFSLLRRGYETAEWYCQKVFSACL